MQCPNCGTVAAPGDNFCPGCGRPFQSTVWDAPSPSPVKPFEAGDGGLEARIAALEARVPKTALLSISFVMRAFAVFGHAVFANCVVYARIIAVAFFFIVIGSLFQT